MLHDVSLENHLEGLGGSSHHLQAVGVDGLLLVEDEPGVDPGGGGDDVGSAPAHSFQRLERRVSLRGERGGSGSSHRHPPG